MDEKKSKIEETLNAQMNMIMAINKRVYKLEQKSKPYVCPICGGTGTVPAHFYAKNQGTCLGGEVECESCWGRGIVWG